MPEELEDKYERFRRNTDIDLQAEIAAGGTEGGLANYYTKAESDAITDALDVRVTSLEEAPGGGGELDSDLQDIGALSPANNDIIQRKSGAWTNRTPDQLKTDMLLNNVNNTSDVNKPISTAVQGALDAKAPLASPAFTGTPSGITAAHVGLGNVNNTSDANKPISTATQTALDGKAASTHNHTAAQTTSGTFDIARIPTGTSGTTVALGNHTHSSYAEVTNTPRYLMFNTTWPARPADSRMTFYIGGDAGTDAPNDSVPGDVWIPSTGGL
jgi:hypothetical protein